MDIFISWSGLRSEAAAIALRDWLPKIVNAFNPWLSSADIGKGARWSLDVAVRLATAKAGIICLTPSNLSSEWILFEAGALSKTLESTFVCTLLIGLEPADVSGPLAQFQATRATKFDVLKLLKTLNSGLGQTSLSDAHVLETFEVWWPKLEVELNRMPSNEAPTRPRRTDRELIEELIDLTRNQSRVSGPLSAALHLTENQQAIAFEILRVLNSVGIGRIGGVSIEGPDFKYTGKTRDGAKFSITVPGHTPVGEIEAYIKPQIADLLSRPSDKSPGDIQTRDRKQERKHR
jgi:hypothetical protein